jgi:hypothetical protein
LPGMAWTVILLLMPIRHVSSHTAFLLRWGTTNFLPQQTSNSNLINLYLESSWNYRCKPQRLAAKMVFCYYFGGFLFCFAILRLNSGPHICQARILQLKPSLQSPNFFF